MFLTVKWFWKIIEKLELKILLFSSFLHTIYSGFAGKWTKKIWRPSTWLGCCTSRKGLWNFYWKTSPRPFWRWTYTIMWKSESNFKLSFKGKVLFSALFLNTHSSCSGMISLPITIPQAVKTFPPVSDCLITQLFVLLLTAWHQLLQSSLLMTFKSISQSSISSSMSYHCKLNVSVNIK